MEKEKAVTNTNTLLYLAKLNLLYLAKNIFSEILITKEIMGEILKKESPENIIIENELNIFLKIVKVKKLIDPPLGIGEKSGISFCLENNIKTFLSDDKKARMHAESLGLKVKGILGILLKNLENNHISKEECEKLIKKAIEKGYYISSDLYNNVMQLIRD